MVKLVIIHPTISKLNVSDLGVTVLKVDRLTTTVTV